MNQHISRPIQWPSALFAVFLMLSGKAASQTVARIESVLEKERAGQYEIVPEPADPKKTPAPVPAPAAGPFSVEAGTTLRSGGEDGTVLVLDKTGAAGMNSGSSIKVPDKKENTHSLEQLSGRLYFNIDADELKKTQRAEFRLKTPVALLAVKGTRFFTHAYGTADVIGVHTGTVMVYEPVSRKAITLNGGSAVKVQSGSISPERPLTPEEVAEEVNYSGLKIATVPLSPFREDRPPPNTGPPAALWGKLILRDTTTPAGQAALQERDPDVNSSGIIRLAWPGLPALKQPAVFWSAGRIVIPEAHIPAGMRVAAIRVSVRAAGCSEVALGVANADGSEDFAGPQNRQTSWPPNSGWNPCLLSIPDGLSELRLGVRATPDVSQQLRSRGNIFKVGSIELKDLIILLAPIKNEP